jgi:hypothetical protein
MNKILPAKFRQNEKIKKLKLNILSQYSRLEKKKKKAKLEKFLLKQTFAIFGLCF